MRKKPKQKRSRQMVDALIEATATAIVERGLEGITTHHIAETAGVSVGSLYQYFDDKEALVEALVDKLANEIAQALLRLPMSQDGDLRSNVALIIQFGFGLLNSRDGLYLELVRNWHSLPTDRVMDILQQSFMDLSRVYFLKHYQNNPIQDLHVRIFIISNSVMFTMVRFIGQPQMMTQEEITRGLTDMVVGYLE
ncbi:MULTISPECIES: TetR/AcrR family transcriptional regulator [unclassified Ketobacter]|uniref:TetR/AcrR family transcriptional regulator n=1 Tax=unclassified Ketobacter TaxID=2639109 RepID=UPI0025C1CEA4|nr:MULTISPECIES: TetR/AcrR family transcriptional regulator [unclassified Ketobacter]MCK5789300.1 TetR/AcrR family transcriptional regulator [Ketobacter sp.]